MADKITITADAEQAIKENQRLQKENEKLGKQYDSLKKKSNEAAKEEQRRAREIEAALKKAQTPAERYNATLKEYKKDLEAGRITQVQFNKLRDEELRKLNALTPATTKQSQAVDKNTAAMKRGAQAGKESNSVFSSMLTSVKSYATGIVSATVVLRAFIAELEKSEKLRQRSRDANLTAEEGLQRARANFVADDTVSKKNLDKELKKAASIANVPVAEFATAAADAFSSKGDRSNRFAIDATLAAFAASPNKDVTQARELAQSAGDFAKLGGSQSAEAIVGFLAQGQQSARITNVAQLGQTAFPAVSAAVQNGASIEQGMEQFIALNNLIGDAEGRVSSTASIALTEQMQTFAAENSKGSSLKGLSPAQQIQQLQQNPEIAKAFMEFASFEKKALAGVRSLVTGDERGLGALTDTQRKIGSLDVAADKENVTAFREYKDFVQGKGTIGGELKAATRESEMNLENQGIGAVRRAITQQVNETLAVTLENVNLPGLDLPKTYVTSKRAALNESPEEALAFARGNLESLVNENQTFRPLGGRLADAGDREFVTKQLQVLERIERELINSREQQAVKQEEVRDAILNNRPRPQNPLERMPVGGSN